MKRYFILAGVEHESKHGKYAIADNCYDVEAKRDGLFLVLPSGERFNLFDVEIKTLMGIWWDIKNAEIAAGEESE
jgi:hypothetical protein